MKECPLCRRETLEPDEVYCAKCEDTLEEERQQLRCSE